MLLEKIPLFLKFLSMMLLKESVSKEFLLNLPRENFFSTQTPQSFNFKEIFNLHSKK